MNNKTTEIIKPGSLKEVSLLAYLFAHLGALFTKREPLKLFLVLGKSKRIFKAWLLFASTLMPFGKLRPFEREFVILCVASSLNCEYELSHHLKLAKRAGLSDKEIRLAVSPQDNLVTDNLLLNGLIKIVASFLNNKFLSEDEIKLLKTHFSEAEIIELLMLIGHYEMLAKIINSLRITKDAPRK